MQKIVRSVFAAVFLAVFSASMFGQTASAQSSVAGPKIMPLTEVKEGARGVARTVFSGTRSEEFGVEILGIVPGAVGPHQDMIIGRLSGANAERTFVFAGMSGSPVYVDGKLIGAIAYSFPFAKEPICGITPIEQMISIFERAPQPRPAASARAISIADLQAASWQPKVPSDLNVSGPVMSGMPMNSKMMAVAGQTFVPIATPVTFTGIAQTTLDVFAPELMKAGILPVASLGGGGKITPLKRAEATTLLGGDSVVVQLARGDISIAAAGTVTMRDNTKIYAFGHPYFGLGSTNLPMAESHVVVVVPNANNSFKMAVADSAVGAMTQDRATGIYGTLGEMPKMMPVRLKVTTSRGRNEEIKFETGIDDFLSPLVVNVGSLNSIAAHERGIGDTTITVKGEIAVRGEDTVRIERRFSGPQASAFAASAPAVPLAALLKSNFDGLDITGVDLNFSVVEGSKVAALERIAVDRTQVRAGETVAATLFIRTDTGRLVSQNVNIVIPADTPAGAMSLMIGDGTTVQKDAAIQQFVPKSTAELIRTLNSTKRPDLLYVYAYKTTAGAVIGSNEMPNLPPSMLATMNNDRTAGGSKPSTQKTIIDQVIPANEWVISGSQTIAIEVIR
ncbi:MAG: hypothetical protein KA746_17400 [Pyrinomonadaceae bacterium]|nr:hypothetical protein [Pyrinomonadaceae bacterium]MBP6212174.1 hypothetical protein [Pyrinomonadaceae bacterium]